MAWKKSFLILATCAAFTLRAADQPRPSYDNNFEKAEVGSLPEEFLVLDGEFTVKEEGGNKFLELPGAPLDTFGLLFGPTLTKNISATARFYGTAKGRRYPTFAVGVNGVGGYKLRVSPGKKALEIYKADALKTSVPLDWKPGSWTWLKISLAQTGEKEWKIEGRIWTDDGKEPESPAITYVEKESLPSGRALISASPYSGTPIRFDDFKVAPLD